MSELKHQLMLNKDRSWVPCYPKSEVDEAIAELEEENESLLQQNRELCRAMQVMYSKEEYWKLQKEIESLKASHYAEMVDAGMRERRLRRALWLARAERAKEKQQLFLFSLDFEKLCIDGFYDPYSGRKELSPKRWVKVFNNVECKCLKKAEEYR